MLTKYSFYVILENMIQLYFLSVLCNALAGYILFKDDNGTDDKFLSTKNPLFHLVLGILCAVTGILKLLSPTVDGVLILGDLVPSAAGVTAGLLMIFGMYRNENSSSPTENDGKLDKLGNSLLRFRKTVGIGLMVISVLHFLFPGALFL